MSAEVRERAFEPFFTTKEVGKGSGLGLSMVYGFARQSGGSVEIDSDEGRGTTVTIYLPCGETPAETVEAPAASPPPRGDNQTVLVVEDNDDLRDMTGNMLRDLGYRTFQAANIDTARRRLLSDPRINLLLSDVGLPGSVDGPAFARELRARFPGFPVVLMSGNPPRHEKDFALLAKPFTSAGLAAALHAALDVGQCRGRSMPQRTRGPGSMPKRSSTRPTE